MLPSASNGVMSLNAIGKVKQSWHDHGWLATALAIVETAFRPVFRLRRRCVFVARLDEHRAPSVWEADERLLIVNATNLNSLPARVWEFLQTEDQQPDLLGIREGNTLFLVMDGVECLHRGYVRVRDAAGSDRKTVFFGDLETLPEIRSCETVPKARGKGLYRRVLNEQLRFLASLGYQRAVLYTMGENTASMKGATAAGFKLHRRLHDWILFQLLVFQRVREAGRTWWRIFVR